MTQNGTSAPVELIYQETAVFTCGRWTLQCGPGDQFWLQGSLGTEFATLSRRAVEELATVMAAGARWEPRR